MPQQQQIPAGNAQPATQAKINREVGGGCTTNECAGDPKAIALTTASAASVNVASANSHLSGRSRRRPPSPISRGATMMMPRASEANQFSQVAGIGAPEL